MKYQLKDTVITTPMDEFILSTVIGGFIMHCSDKVFLQEELLPILAPVQMGTKRAPKFILIPEFSV